MVAWSYFDRFEGRKYDDEGGYLPPSGEGENFSQQVVTAVSKLVYKWYNDGDVYDNTYGLRGWANNLSSYANWLAEYAGASDILDRIKEVDTGAEYEEILKDLADRYFDDDYLREHAEQPKQGTIYSCDGEYEYIDEEDDEDDWDDEEDDYR